ncbi:GxxExxY protein [Cecembia calidifontis]|jgi:GxxExxY protein|uniref:GxxExxY protein n=1 Tax=Cecembia calidifontis TaxID=1187080 RepID=A0A4Q7PAY2_9BACT|nr:GxxExxY protein [Cecembia calidifontis]RZS96710.1 GxxExxY protein [Cecembia calidifontis]
MIYYKNESFQIVGAAMEVHKELGHGFLEKVYHEALEIELLNRNIEFVKEQKLPIYYKENKLPIVYSADFVCFDKIILEIKAISELSPEHTAQVINYLKATKMKLGILINFGSNSLEFKRIVL